MTTTEPEFQIVESNGIKLRVAVKGEGPLVLFVHGFPESWFSWRHQIDAVAAAGYRAAAPDVRGYGGSDKTPNIEDYSLEVLTADMAGVAKALQPDAPAVVVGHDWGAPIAWNSALLCPEQFSAVAGMSVPHMPQGSKTTLQKTNEAFIEKGKFFYLYYFQTPGRAEEELEGDVERAIKTMYYAWSGDAPKGYWHNNKPPESRLFDKLDPLPEKMPDWFPDDVSQYYIDEFERNGFRGPLNRYRNFERDQKFLLSQPSQVIQQPAMFIGGDKDPALVMAPSDLKAALAPNYRDLRALHMLEGVGHWTQQEAPEQVNDLLLDWLADVCPKN